MRLMYVCTYDARTKSTALPIPTGGFDPCSTCVPLALALSRFIQDYEKHAACSICEPTTTTSTLRWQSYPGYSAVALRSSQQGELQLCVFILATEADEWWCVQDPAVPEGAAGKGG